ncbi:hypothetical protein BCR44DRAFT_1428398 [Catenaria anguillulae PL171]|uniref:Ankyrin repeat-containing domain protein n=1 Tax=Catenaria anguillulae PL171 TaxID=765915 RepID=A0A1Y2HZB4_9FUNG|nr:hypothetical protein BCR44DRAFT_1428398 [Catenaria anguillulae PL171]
MYSTATTIPQLSLPVELAEPVLIALLRFCTLPAARGSSKVVHAALNTLSRTLVPDVTRTALIKLWWYSFDDIPPCSTSWLLPMLLDLEQCNDRPLMYTVDGLANAARRGDIGTMDAWFESGLLDDADEFPLSMARHAGGRGGEEHLIQVWEWWLKCKLPWGGPDAIDVDLVLALSYSDDEDVCLRALEWWGKQEWLTLGPVPWRVLVETSGRGFVRVLDWWRAQDGARIWGASEEVLIEASRGGHAHVLEWWWLHFQSSVKCTEEMTDAAIEGGGHLHVLEWWIDKFPLSNPLKSNSKKHQVLVLNNVADLASRHGHVHILQWWFNQVSVMSKSYHTRTKAAVDHAAERGHVAVLNFWLKCSKHPKPHQRMSFMYKNAPNWACAAGRLEVLEWFLSHFPLALDKVSPCPLKNWTAGVRSQCMTLQCLDWRVQHGIPTRFSHMGTAMLRQDRRVEVLEWIVRNGIDYKLGRQAFLSASAAGQIAVLDFLLEQLGREQVEKQLVQWNHVLDRPPSPVLERLTRHKFQVSDMIVTHFMDCSKRVEWAVGLGLVSIAGALQQCIDVCARKGDYESISWCLQQYPAEAKQEILKRANVLHQFDFGMIEFLTMHHLLPQLLDNALLAITQQTGTTRLSPLIRASLPLLDWIHTQLQRRLSRSLSFSWKEEFSMIAKGDLGFCRWVKRRRIGIRDV